MAVTRAPSLLPAVRFESRESNNGAPLPRNPSPSVPPLSISKPSWIVRTEVKLLPPPLSLPPPCLVSQKGAGKVKMITENKTNCKQDESNVRKVWKKKPDPPCVVCLGSGRVDCYHCNGKGRTNSIHLAMLPKGEWPKWCRCCGGSGLGYCSRCLGTGEYRHIMGFHFMKRDSNDTQGHQNHKVRDNSGPQTAADLLLNGDQRSLNPTPDQQ